jgi:hypothetical protein
MSARQARHIGAALLERRTVPAESTVDRQTTCVAWQCAPNVQETHENLLPADVQCSAGPTWSLDVRPGRSARRRW